ncbi:SdrD B-like domain-containing protein [Saccharothrix xinjiangensis]|uniref:alpha-amylase n=1 Tax=Saccharothrix xinjiangensis TaxID=204798 RepID=A0ABV9XWP5_9PSEU
MSYNDVARPNGARRTLRAATAGLVALAVALSGPVAHAQETEPPAVATTTPTTTPTEAPSPTGTPAETPVETPTTSPTDPGPTDPGVPDQPLTGKTAERGAAPVEERPAAQALPPANLPDLALTVAFDREEYAVTDDIGVTITVRNKGDAPAEDVRFTVNGSVDFGVGGLELGRVPGPTLAPGEGRTYDLVGRSRHLIADSVYLTVGAHVGPQSSPSFDPTPNDNSASDTARLPRSGSVKGVAYRDANGNGRFDEGEGLANRTVTARTAGSQSGLGGATDSTGRFTFDHVQPGAYQISVDTYPDRLVVAPRAASFTVRSGEALSLELPVVPTVDHVLRSLVEFDRDSYLGADPVGIRVALTNSGAVPLANVVAVCSGDGEDGRIVPTGPEWAPLDPDGPGVTLAAGETRVFALTEAVPAGAVAKGELSISCHFGNAGRSTSGYVGGSDHADVDDNYGDLRGTLLFDSGDGAPVPLAGAWISVYDARTRLTSRSALTEADGRFTFPRIERGEHRFLLAGPYRDRATGDGWFTAEVTAGGTTDVEFVAVPGPLVELPRPDYRLDAEIAFDRTTYDINDPVRVKVRLTNAGANSGMALVFQPEWARSALEHDPAQWRALSPYDSGVERLELWPGETYEIELVGRAPTWGYDGKVRLKGRIGGTVQVPVDLSADVTVERGDVEVLAFADADADGVADTGEELPGTRVHLAGGVPHTEADVVTGANGRASAEDLPAGVYRTSGAHDGWVEAFDHYANTRVVGDGGTVLEIPLIRSMRETLDVRMEFAEASYLPTDRPGLTVSLTNDTGRDLTVHVNCDDAGRGHGVLGGPQWGPLHEGLPLAAGATWSGAVTADMPASAADHGRVTAACSFGPLDAYDGGVWEGSPLARAEAKVPGATWTTTGRVEVRDTYPQVVVPDVKLVLLDPATGAPVARTTTGRDGSFTFPDLPVGAYTPVVVGPWEVVLGGPGPLFEAVRGELSPEVVFVVPGPEVADPDLVRPDPAPGGPPAGGAPDGGSTGGGSTGGGSTGGGSTGGGSTGGDSTGGGSTGGGSAGGPVALASTGASVLGLGLLGLLVLALGLGTRVLGRRAA